MSASVSVSGTRLRNLILDLDIHIPEVQRRLFVSASQSVLPMRYFIS